MASIKSETLDIYGRQSRLGDERQRSPEGQVGDCQARVEERGAAVGEVFVDAGKSAWNPRVKRPAWDALMERLETGQTDGVIVFDLARFSRRPIEGERLITAAERGLTVLDSEGEYDLTSPSGKKAFRDQLNSAAYESDRLSTRVKRGKRLKAGKGESNHSTRPYGFEADGVTIREDEAAIVRDLTDRVLAGEALHSLTVGMNASGVPTPSGGPWNPTSMRQLLTRPRNAGRVTYRDEVVGDAPGEPLIAPDVFDRLCAVFTARRRGRPVSETYLCSGIATCGRCGNGLTGRVRAKLSPYDDGEPRRQYWCHKRPDGRGCGRLTVDWRHLDAHIRDLVIRTLADPKHAAAIEEAARNAADRRHEIDAEIVELESTAEELAARLGRGEIPLARFDAATQPLDKRLAVLRAQRAEIEDAPTVPVLPAVRAASEAVWRERWKVATVAERRTLLRQVLRGRRLVILPLAKSAPRKFDPKRVKLSE